MNHHVYVRIVGYGLAIIPIPGVRIAQAPETPGGLRFTPEDADQPTHLLNPVAAVSEPQSLDGVCKVSPLQSPPEWRLQTSAYSCAWPPSFSLVAAADSQGPSLFDLLGPEDVLLYFQGPFADSALPSPEDMAAPEQTFAGVEESQGRQIVTLSYRHNGSPWTMLHVLSPWTDGHTMILTAQFPEEQSEPIRHLAEETLTSIRRTDGSV